MSANIKASVDGTQAIIGVGGVDQMTVSNAGVVTANSFVGSASSATALATGSTTARTLANRFADVVNVKDFGAVGDGVADDTAAIQAAINYAGGISNNPTSVYIPSTQNGYRVTSTLNITYITSNRIYLYGDGFAVRGTYAIGKSSELFFDHAGIGILINQVSGTIIDGISTRRNQPTPTSGWTPNAFDFDICVESSNDVTIRNCLIRNATKGIRGYRIGYGKLNLFNIKMQAFDVGIEIDEMYDVARFNDIHIWPFWSEDSNVITYTQANLIGLNSLRNDNPNIVNFFTFGAKYGIRCGSGAGPASFTTRALIVNAGFDNVGSNGAGLLIAADLTSVQIENSYSFDGLNGIYVAANNTRLQVSNFRSSANKGSAISVGGINNKVQLSTILIEGFNTNNTAGITAILAVAGNEVFVDGKIIASTTSGEPTVNSFNTVESDEWFGFTPGVTSSLGTITSYTTIGKVRRQSGMLKYDIQITITAAGTAAGQLLIAMPYFASHSSSGCGRELSTSNQISADITSPTNLISVNTYNGGTVLVTGYTVRVTGEYKTL